MRLSSHYANVVVRHVSLHHISTNAEFPFLKGTDFDGKWTGVLRFALFDFRGIPHSGGSWSLCRDFSWRGGSRQFVEGSLKMVENRRIWDVFLVLCSENCSMSFVGRPTYLLICQCSLKLLHCVGQPSFYRGIA